jgi:hypothetical protein
VVVVIVFVGFVRLLLLFELDVMVVVVDDVVVTVFVVDVLIKFVVLSLLLL